MSHSETELIGILSIARNEAGLSLSDAIKKSNYRLLRPGFGVEELLPLLCADTQLMTQWQRYSENKRSNGGWALGECHICEPSTGTVEKFSSAQETLANYVLREMDFWAKVGDGH